MTGSEGDRQTSCANLTSARGESRTVEVVLFHFIIPAVCYILSCMGQSVTSTSRTIRSALSRTYWSEWQQYKKSAPWSHKSLWGTCCLQCCTFCHPVVHCGRCFMNHNVRGWHISAVSHGVWALKHSAKWRGNRSQLFTFRVGQFTFRPVDWIIVCMEGCVSQEEHKDRMHKIIHFLE